MNIAFYTAASGVKTFQKGMDTLANNMANINTNGYKEIRSAFSEQLYTNMTHYAEREGRDLKTGHGVKQISTDVIFGQGTPMQTDRNLDFCIIGDGFFGIRTKPDNEMRYTRNGNFSLQLNGKKTNLITGSGDVLTDKKGKAIEVSIDENNNIDMEKLLNEMGIYEFDNPYALEPEGTSLYSENERTGKGIISKNASIKTGMLEGSNVDMSKEMSEVIMTQRAFQFNARVVQIADELEQTVNTLR
ncbi:MAG: flagellar hook-basal body protein [Oscillospiraceae bacterium]